MKRARLIRVLVLSGLLAVAVAAVGWAAIAATGDEPVTAARFSITIDGTEIASFGELGGISSRDRRDRDGAVGRRAEAAREAHAADRHAHARIDSGPRALGLARGGAGRRPRYPQERGHRDVSFDGTEIARYRLENAWPAKLEIGALKAGASAVLMETVTLVCERIQRVSV